jgi:pimeloyl-ACP methyl ester carboxylesterase
VKKIEKAALAAAGLVAAGLLTGCGSSGSTAQTAAEQQVAGLPAKFTKQRLDWKQCPATDPIWKGVRCALLTVPVDYANPDGRSMTVAVDEWPASGRKTGVLFTNPGGPGGEGLTMPVGVAYASPALRSSFDIVGMNPRGFGPYQGNGAGATTLTCSDKKVPVTSLRFPDWAGGDLRVLATAAQEQEAQCQATADGLRQYVTTANAARDMDLLRTVMGQQSIDYYGVSYGTYLGATYGAMFPDDLNRMVLDGSMSPQTTWYEQSVPDNETAVFNFNEFAGWAVKNKQGLGDSVAAVRSGVSTLDSDLRTKPDGGYTWHQFATAVGTFTRNRPDWRAFAASLRNALVEVSGRRGSAAVDRDVADADAQASAQDTKAEDDGISTGVYYAVTCDWSWPKADDAGYRVYQDNMSYWARTFPYGGTVQAVGPTACTYNATSAAGVPPITSRTGYPQGLVVNADGDTQTPLSTAKEMARTLGFNLITVTNDGTHGLSFNGNACVDRAVTNYFRNGTLPGDITCPTATGPGDAMSLTQATRDSATRQ